MGLNSFYVQIQAFEPLLCSICKQPFGDGAKGYVQMVEHAGQLRTTDYFCMRCHGQRPVGQSMPADQLGGPVIGRPKT